MTMTTLILSAALRSQLEAEARAAFPRECCGLIEGVREPGAVHAEALHPAANVGAHPDEFEIDPGAHLGHIRRLRGSGREIVGCYHSHPGGQPVPSQRDRESGSQGFVWLIAALPGAGGPVELGAFEGAPFRPVSLT